MQIQINVYFTKRLKIIHYRLSLYDTSYQYYLNLYPPSGLDQHFFG